MTRSSLAKRLPGLALVVGALLVLVVLYALFKLPLPASGPIQNIFFGSEPTPARQELLTEPITFQIVQEESEARYIIGEMQGMTPNKVVGVTDQVAGEFVINPSAPHHLEMPAIMINARTLETDEELRDRAVRNRILCTDKYEYITFTPTSFEGLPEQGYVGEAYEFEMTGELNLLDQTYEVTWEVTVTAVTEERLEGEASTTVRYADWGIEVPEMPFIASVDETVRLELDFVAIAVEE